MEVVRPVPSVPVVHVRESFNTFADTSVIVTSRLSLRLIFFAVLSTKVHVPLAGHTTLPFVVEKLFDVNVKVMLVYIDVLSTPSTITELIRQVLAFN